MFGDISMGSKSITSMADPSTDQDAATKKYVDDNAGPGGDCLKLDCSNDPLTAPLDVLGMISSVDPAGEVNYIGMYHDGADGILGVNIGSLALMPVDDLIALLSDKAGVKKLSIQNSDEDEVASIDSLGRGAVDEITLTPKASSNGAEGTLFYCSEDDHVYVGTED